ncbi:MAG: ABC transporter ATP-binding protein [Bacteroidales bacterium]|nr:ABC transporter ATP-binding protein [Bacteroidales bacterium]
MISPFQWGRVSCLDLLAPTEQGKPHFSGYLQHLLLPGSGSATLEGYDVVKDFRKIRDILGYMPGKFSLYQDLTVEENLRFFAGIFKTTPEANYDLVKEIYSQIEPFKTRRAGKLSGGMKQKLALSCALIHKPEVLILDEPTTGVDAVSRKEFWDMLDRLKRKGITILVSTPYMDEAMRCDRVALIQAGKIMDINTPEGIIKNFSSRLWSVRTNDTYELLLDLRRFKATRSAFLFGQHIHLTLVDNAGSEPEIRKFLEDCGHQSVEIEETRPTIEDCFMDLMKG